MITAGIDGCRAGWFLVQIDADDRISGGIYPTISAVWDAVHEAERDLIDMPIGLSDDGERGVESAARMLLGARSSSIFNPPARPVLAAKTYAEASRINAELSGKKLSKQTWNIMPKICEVDDFLHAELDARSRLLESHPELVFAAFNGGPLRFNKKAGPGFALRLALLAAQIGGVHEAVYAIREQHTVSDVADDDILDALALALAARMPLVTLPDAPRKDAAGLPMQIVMPQMSPPHTITRINHVQITIPVGAESEAQAFYCDVLGLREIAKPGSLAGRGGFWVMLAGQQVHIGTEDGVDRHASKAHIAYEVRDLAHWRERLISAGCTIKESVPLPGYDRFETRDPFGNRIEFIAPQYPAV